MTETTEPYDSRADTLEHISTVRGLLWKFINSLKKRSRCHDESKLEDPEKPYFDEFTPKLKGLTYGSDEYKQSLKELKVGLDHHYAQNSHHPEHFSNGINDMNLADIVEMFCDWKAATMRHADGDIRKSIELNKERFGMSDQLVDILMNSVELLE